MIRFTTSPVAPLLCAANPALMQPFLRTIRQTIANGDYQNMIRPNRDYPDLPVRQMTFELKADERVHRLSLRINIMRFDEKCLFKFQVVRESAAQGHRLLAIAYPDDAAMQGTSIASLREGLTKDDLLALPPTDVLELGAHCVTGFDDVIEAFLSARN